MASCQTDSFITDAIRNANAKKSTLVTQDPFHIPGYIGYVPKFKYHIGDTFANATHKILLDNHAPGSQWSVLSETKYVPPMQYEKLDAIRGNLVKSRTQSWGDQKLRDDMVPGYTGNVPKMINYFGKRYTEDAFRATADFEYHAQRDKKDRENLRLSIALQNGKMAPKSFGQQSVEAHFAQTPMRPIAKEPAPFITPHVYPQTPYALAQEDPEKFFISGYKGFVPRERFIHGKGHTMSTNNALLQFNDEQESHRHQQSAPVSVQKPERPQSYDGVIIYPECSGIIPDYKGYIPQRKFNFGERYTVSTDNALKIGTAETMQPRRTRDCANLDRANTLPSLPNPKNCFSCSGAKAAKTTVAA